MRRRSCLFPILLAVAVPVALDGQTCPMGQPQERRASQSEVEPHPPEVVKRKVPELLNRAGYWIETADTAAGRFVSLPIFSWSQRRAFDPWRHLVHPGVVVTVTVTPVERWSRVAAPPAAPLPRGRRALRHRVAGPAGPAS